jgi:putative N6-adenine-specific DNA methylase
MRASREQRCFASAARGLEAVLAEEARMLGRATPVAGGVEVVGPSGVVEEACLRLRTANRVLLRLTLLSSGRWEDAAKVLAVTDLSKVAPPGAPLWLESTVRVTGAPSAPALRAWLERKWQRPVHGAAGEDRASPGTRLVLSLRPEGGSLSADASGELLYRRGWRQEVGRAPLRETLAAGVLALADWTPAAALWDPMCGSGTLLVEAALRARNVSPGLGRAFAFEQWPGTDGAAWAGRRARAFSEALPAAPLPLHGSDVNAGALGTTRRNARRAGVLDSLVLERVDIRAVAPGGVSPGLLVANLPYGRRMGRRSEMDALFGDVADALRTRFRGWRAALLTADPERLAAALEGRVEAVIPLENGGLQVGLCVVAPADGMRRLAR